MMLPRLSLFCVTVLFPRHFANPDVATTTTLRLQLFRDYLHYHISEATFFLFHPSRGFHPLALTDDRHRALQTEKKKKNNNKNQSAPRHICTRG
jgi:hypothetical protein